MHELPGPQFIDAQITTPEIIIPKEIVGKLKAGSERVTRRFQDPHHPAPDSIVALQRGAPLYIPAVNAYAQERGVTLPPILEAPIGQSLVLAGPPLPGPEAIYAGHSLDKSREAQAFRKWLRQDSLGADLRSQLAAQADNAGISVRNPLIIDDAQNSGNTRLAAIALVRDAFGLKKAPAYEALFGYMRPPLPAVMQNILAGKDGKQQLFLLELVKGYLYKGAKLEEITTADHLAELSDSISRQGYSGNNDPYASLRLKYGDDGLLGLRTSVMNALTAAITS